MKVFKNLDEISQFLGISCWKVEEHFKKQCFRGLMVINDFEFVFHITGQRMLFIHFDSHNDEDCKQYFMEYEKDIYTWKVYVDDIEKWQTCEVLDVYNNRLDIYRAIVRTPHNTQLNRLCKYALDKDEVKSDGCIYFIDKE